MVGMNKTEELVVKNLNLFSEDILGYQVINCNLWHCLKSVNDWIEMGTGCRVLTCLNPHSYAVSRSNYMFSKALDDADWQIGRAHV